ncbi:MULTISPECIES: bi-domain-containing oxidoreductase [unclassified Synechococcus]|uniref:bi-domain-containing oxidoreductase n=1 Tax=unclassified Synechococcus TaxID=2626047 RepID=UPI001CA3DFE6|nr:bi-domain-containing oxidoreductase [Synechococcus sp. MIT S9220]
MLELPVPSTKDGHILIRTHCSLLSSGTERMLVEFGRSNIFDKALQQPDKVKQVFDKLSTDGLLPTFDSIQSKLDSPIPLGYCNVGTVISVGKSVSSISVGDRVVSNGPHAEIVSVPSNLCAVIPSNVSDEEASFVVLAAIGLQGIRLLNPTFGETFLVSGLGLIGLLTSQLLLANGCRVLGIDPDVEKCLLAQSFGVSTLDLSSDINPVSWCYDETDNVGVDGVLITASTASSEPVHTAAMSCRQRGRIVLIGVSGLDLQRDLFYKKELSFQVSCSYGPGRYDPLYEQSGIDYPVGFVRWTENRNFIAILHAFAKRSLSIKDLISHRFDFDNASNAYDLLMSKNNSFGILLRYSSDHDLDRRTVRLRPDASATHSSFGLDPTIAVLGSGNYSSRVLIPSFKKAGAQFHTLISTSGGGPVLVGMKYGFVCASTDVNSAFHNPSINTIVIATRHDSHASLVVEALACGKHVFVEKPLCLTTDQLNCIEKAYNNESILTVGFNRRFAPLILELNKQLKSLSGPKAFVYTCNAGFIPSNHWTQSPELGGGRLLGEACHFVDLLRHLAASPIQDLQVTTAASHQDCSDTFSLQLRFVDGSIGTVHYFANGSRSFPKERLEVFASGKVFCLDNFRKLKAWGIPGFRTRRSLSQDKGHQNLCASFLNSIEAGQPPPIPVSEIFEVQRFLLQSVNQ